MALAPDPRRITDLIRGSTFRRKLTINFVLSILVTLGVALVMIIDFGARVEAESAAKGQVVMSADAIFHRTSAHFRPAANQLKMIAEHFRLGLHDIDDTQKLNLTLAPMIQNTAMISSVLIASSEGQEFLLLPTEDGWMNRLTPAHAAGSELSTPPRMLLWDAIFDTMTEEPLDRAYSPHTRPWFMQAMQGDLNEIYATAPYTFFTTGDPGMTLSTRVQPNDMDKPSIVIGVDILLKDCSRFTESIHFAEHGRAFLATEDANVLGLPAGVDDNNLLLRPLSALPSSVYEHAFRRVQAGQAKRDAPFDFEFDGDRWWAVVHGVRVGERWLWVGTLVPNNDYLAPALTRRNWMIALITLALAASWVMAVLLSRRFASPLRSLAAQSERIANLHFEDHAPITSNIQEIQALASAQQNTLRALDSFSRYIPTGVVRQLLDQGNVAQVGGIKTDLTVLFSDIRGFTSISENAPPEQVAQHLSEYFGEVLEVLEGHGATIDKLIGDAAMAFWGAPIEDPEQADHALNAALACQARLHQINKVWRAEGKPELPTGFGIACGPAVVGNMGSPKRMNYTAVGDTVNTASRLEGLNRHYGTSILVDQACKEAAKGAFVWQHVDDIQLRGRTQRSRLYELVGMQGEVSEEKLAFIAAYEQGLALRNAGQLGKAFRHMQELAQQHPMDKAIQVILDELRQRTATTAR